MDNHTLAAVIAMSRKYAGEIISDISADIAQNVTEWLDNHVDPETGYIIDDTLTIQGVAADAKKTGDELTDLKNHINNHLLTDEAKTALLNIFSHVAWLDDEGQETVNALYDALYSEYPQIKAVFNSGTNIIFTDDSLNSLKQYLTVTYYETRTSVGTVIPDANYSLSGTLEGGTSTILVEYTDLTATVIINNVVDFYNNWMWSYPSMLLGRYLGNITATNDGDVCTNTNVLTRANISTNKGKKEIYDIYTSMYLQNRYPIPIPAGATSVTVTCDSDFWFSGSEWVLQENQYTRLQDLGSFGYGGGTTKSLGTGNNRFLTLVGGMSGNPDLNENNKPTSVTITFA